MFRITRGNHVQHVRFPFPVLGPRALDQQSDDEEQDDALKPDPTPSATGESGAEAREG